MMASHQSVSSGVSAATRLQKSLEPSISGRGLFVLGTGKYGHLRLQTRALAPGSVVSAKGVMMITWQEALARLDEPTQVAGDVLEQLWGEWEAETQEAYVQGSGEAYEDGYNVGYLDGRAAGFDDGYTEASGG